MCECEFVHLRVSVHASVLLCDCMFNVYMAVQMGVHEQACCTHVNVCIFMHVSMFVQLCVTLYIDM